jgi:hypothetical protein
VDLQLHIGGKVLPLSQVGLDYCDLVEPVALPPGPGEIVVIVDGNEQRTTVELCRMQPETERRLKIKNQHTVSEAYLRGFTAGTTPNSLWQYDKATGECKRRNVSAATVWHYAYSYRESDGTWNHLAEQELARIEDKAISCLKKLISESAESLDNEERSAVSLFIAATFRRSRMLIEHYQEGYTKYCNHQERQLGLLEELKTDNTFNFIDEDIEFAEQYIAEGKLDSNEDELKASQLEAILRKLTMGARLIGGMHWKILSAKSPQCFLTSDSPVIIRLTNDPLDSYDHFVRPGDVNAELTFPLSRQRLLLARHNPWGESTKASKTRVRELNARIIRMASSRAYAPFESDEIASLLAEYRHFQPPRPPIVTPPQV